MSTAISSPTAGRTASAVRPDVLASAGAFDIHLSHEVLAGPAVTAVTASLDATRDTHTFGTFLSLLSLYEHDYQERAPVWNTFTAEVEPIAPSTEVSRVEFRLAT